MHEVKNAKGIHFTASCCTLMVAGECQYSYPYSYVDFLKNIHSFFSMSVSISKRGVLVSVSKYVYMSLSADTHETNEWHNIYGSCRIYMESQNKRSK